MERLGLVPSVTEGRADERAGGRRLVLPLVISVAMLAALALSLVWLNLERTNLAYKVRELQRQVQEGLDLNAKLGIERDHLLSPHELGKKAGAMGLGSARPGQIRRLEDGAEAAGAADVLTEPAGRYPGGKDATAHDEKEDSQ